LALLCFGCDERNTFYMKTPLFEGNFMTRDTCSQSNLKHSSSNTSHWKRLIET